MRMMVSEWIVSWSTIHLGNVDSGPPTPRSRRSSRASSVPSGGSAQERATETVTPVLGTCMTHWSKVPNWQSMADAIDIIVERLQQSNENGQQQDPSILLRVSVPLWFIPSWESLFHLLCSFSIDLRNSLPSLVVLVQLWARTTSRFAYPYVPLSHEYWWYRRMYDRHLQHWHLLRQTWEANGKSSTERLRTLKDSNQLWTPWARCSAMSQW